MVGDSKSRIPHILRPPNELERDEFSVAEYSVGMQIYHPKKIQEDGEKCKATRSASEFCGRISYYSERKMWARPLPQIDM